MWVYQQSEPNLFTVGFYDPKGTWHPESDFNSREQAANRVIELNGGKPAPPPPPKIFSDFNKDDDFF